MLCLLAVGSLKLCNNYFLIDIKEPKMKTSISAIVIAAILFAACNNNNSSVKENKNTEGDSTSQSKMRTDNATEQKTKGSIDDILSGYLQLKNALTNDNGNEAAEAGKAIVQTMSKIDRSVFNAEQLKAYDDISGDLKENAEHIGDNAGKIAHQREHFEILSTDIYDLLKVFKANETLYKDFCPMVNDGKGAYWISEIKEIKNPYQGKKMPTCGSVKEEIK